MLSLDQTRSSVIIDLDRRLYVAMYILYIVTSYHAYVVPVNLTRDMLIGQEPSDPSANRHARWLDNWWAMAK
jgi:hypothetical protein